MITISATEIKQKFGEHVANAVAEPIVVEKFGRPFVVMLSYAEYKRLQALEDRYWGEIARTAEEEGYASSEETKEFQANLATGLQYISPSEKSTLYSTSQTAPMAEENDRWEFYKDNEGEWRWRRIAPNGQIVEVSSGGWKNKQDCIEYAKRHEYRG